MKYRFLPLKQNINTSCRDFVQRFCVVIYVLLFANKSGDDGSSIRRRLRHRRWRRRRRWRCVEIAGSDCVHCDGDFVCCDLVCSDVDSPITSARFASITFGPTVHMRCHFLCFLAHCLLSHPPCKISSLCRVIFSTLLKFDLEVSNC